MTDFDFIAELDKTISNAGSEEIWKRTVGGIEIWFSPITATGREAVNEVLNKSNAGVNVVGESKRLTLSYAIVGINNIDLHEYKHGQAVFPILDREKKQVKVTLDKYIYDKMRFWGDQFLDDVFMVYGDLLESHARENLKDVKFENKDPRLELAELQQRANTLRASLGLPKLVEEQPGAVSPEDEEPLGLDGEENEEAPPKGFSPFQPVPQQAQTPEPEPEPEIEVARPPPQPPVMTIPVPVIRQKGVPSAQPNPPGPPSPEDLEFESQQQAAVVQQKNGPILHKAQPSVSTDEVIEESAASRNKGVPRPVIDKPPTNINPRFHPPSK